MIHRGYANAIKQHVSNEVCALVILELGGERWLFGSIYLPDSGKGLDTYRDGLQVLDQSLASLKPFRRMVLGGDANAEMMSDGCVVGPKTTGQVCSVKTAALFAWSSRWRLAWDSTWMTSQNFWTHRPKKHTRTCAASLFSS